MKVVFHPEFPRDQRKFEADYGDISPALAGRFREEIDGAIAAIKAAPSGAGHFIHTGSLVVPEFRRRKPVRPRPGVVDTHQAAPFPSFQGSFRRARLDIKT